MKCLVVYDVSDDALRDRIAEAIDDYGVRVQWSVFECSLNDADRGELERRVIALLKGQADATVRIYPTCNRCAAGVVVLGKDGAGPGTGAYVVI